MSHMLMQAPTIVAEATGDSWGLGKKGVVPKDADGYYCGILVGALGTYNKAGEFYEVNDKILDVIMNKSVMAKRLKEKKLYIELGHPKRIVRDNDGNSVSLGDKAFCELLLNISDRSICGHVRKYWVSKATMADRYGNYPYFIYADVKPDGPYGHVLESRMSNQDSNACFSMRWFADRVTSGDMCKKSVFEAITFDFVGDGGIAMCTKENVLSFEESRSQVVMTKGVVVDIRAHIKNTLTSNEFNEINSLLDSIEDALDNKCRMSGSFYM